jgi:hypothetical protein
LSKSDSMVARLLSVSVGLKSERAAVHVVVAGGCSREMISMRG